MLCPECPRRLEKATRHDVPVWACRDCDGCAVELAALRDVVDRSQIDLLLLRAGSPGAAWGKPCPQCVARGREARVRDARRLYVLDWCAACEVLWFDVSELEGLVPAPQPPQAVPDAGPAAGPAASAAADEEGPAQERARAKPRSGKRRRKGSKRRRAAPRRRAPVNPSSADIVAELAGDVGVEALLALLSDLSDG